MGSHEGLSASNPVDEMDIGINEVRISTDLPIGPPSAGLAMQMHLSSRPRLTCCGGCARQLCGFKGHAGEVDDRLRNAAVEQAMLDVASITNTAALRYASTLALAVACWRTRVPQQQGFPIDAALCAIWPS